MKIPLYGFLTGDTIGLLIVADSAETVRELAESLQQAAGVRVAPQSKCELIYRGSVVEPGLTLEQAGIEALERFDVVPC